MKLKLATLAALVAATSASHAQVKITEVMYTGLFGEFIEVTNFGSTILAADVDNYSFDDSGSSAPGAVVFPDNQGNWATNQAVIITEVSATIFDLAWYEEPLTGTAPYTLPSFTYPIIIENNSQNLGRNDAVNIYFYNGSTYTTADQLTYNDQSGNGPRSEDVSMVPYVGWDYTLPNATNSGVTDWFLSTSGNVATKWKAGVSGTGAGGGPIPGPFGSPGYFATSSSR